MITIETARQYLIAEINIIRELDGQSADWEVLFDEDFNVVGKAKLDLENKDLLELIRIYGEHQNVSGFNDGVCK